jgi:hypothetical protein
VRRHQHLSVTAVSGPMGGVLHLHSQLCIPMAGAVQPWLQV